MTKTETDARRLAVPAACAGASLSAMIFASRLPPTLDFILPRRAGWALFAASFDALSSPGGRAAYSLLAPLPLLAAAALFVRLAASAARGRKWTARDFLSRGLAVALAAALARWSFTVWFEVGQKVWFPYGSLNILEPFANAAVCSGVFFAAMRAALGFLAAKPAPVGASLKAWTSANALASVLAMAAYGAWTPAPPAATERLAYVVLTQDGARPDQAGYDLPVQTPAPARGVRRLESLRAAYEEKAKRMDLDGLRAVLLSGVEAGDELARSLLLRHASAAAPSDGERAALGVLADESVHRIGPLGASGLARAYAHLGDAASAAAWSKKAASGPRGIPEGLIELPRAGALARVSGRAEGLRPLRVGIYRRADPAAPYLLDAGTLASAAEPDAKGRFSFPGLPEGRYYLAFAFAPRAEPIRAFGHRGDLILDGRAAALEVPPLTFK